MSSLTNINNNSSVVNVGRTTPVSPGQQPAARSIPVVLASNQAAIPVVEQNKIQSEVALSLLGIPRAEVALGIFADVNTYDVNPTEWSSSPPEYTTGYGIKHLPEEAGALVEAPKDEVSVLTSKRFFRYQPGRVSAATFGVKSTLSPGPVNQSEPTPDEYDLNPSIRKFGIFDKFDGYYWETMKDGVGDNFTVVRRTQSLLKYVPVQFGVAQSVDHAIAGKGPSSTVVEPNAYPAEYISLNENRFRLAKQVVDDKIAKCKRDVGYFITGIQYDITLGTNYNAVFLGIAETNSLDLNQYVYDTITATRVQILALPAVSGDPTSVTRVTTFFTELLNITQNGRAVASTVTFTNPTSATVSQIACKDRLTNNETFITNEINAWVAAYIAANGLATDHNVAKCTRDVKYALNSFKYDMLYGGNSATYDQAKFFLYFDGDEDNNPPSILSTHKQATIAAYGRLKTVISQIVQGISVTPSVGNSTVLNLSGNSATSADALILEGLAQIIPDVITAGTMAPLNALTKTYPSVTWSADPLEASKTAIEDNRSNIIITVAPGGYTVADLKCIRDLGFVLDGVALDVALATNYNSIFLGRAEDKSIDVIAPGGTVVTTITGSKTRVLALAQVADSATSISRVNAFYSNLLTVAGGGASAALSFPSRPTTTSESQAAAKDKLVANKAFIQAEITAWLGSQFTLSAGEITTCTQYIGSFVDSVCYDMFYVCNMASYDAAKFFFWYNSIEHTSSALKSQTIAAYQRLREILANIVQGIAITKTASNALTQSTAGINSSLDDSVTVQDLVQIAIDVIGTGLVSLPEVRTTPVISWAAQEFRDANTDINTNKTAIIGQLVQGGTYSSIDLKCLRDLDFAIDAYLYDLKWGGNGYTSVNASNYVSAIPALNLGAEITIHTALRNTIISLFETISVNNPASARITSLATIIINAVGGVSQPTLASISWGSAAPVKTVLLAKKFYLAYSVSEKDAAGVAITYTLPSPNPTGITLEALKYKCQRDIKYIIEGYIRDLADGGDMGTVFNAKKYYSNGVLVIYSQQIGGAVSEIARHTYLRTLIINILTQYALGSFISKFTSLANLIISNFTAEYQGQGTYGNAAQFADLIILRDNLIMTHAAVFDPSLLKAKENILVDIDAVNNTLTATGGSFIIGQYINFYGTAVQENAAGLISNKLYKIKEVKGIKGNVIVLTDPMIDGDTAVDLVPSVESIYINPSVPFVFPKEYYTGPDAAESVNPIRVDGQFPYAYSSNGDLPITGAETKKVGYIDTAIDTSGLNGANAQVLKSQIDALNLEYNNWIKENVDPIYYAVYEYRVPRSRFSTDQLNGTTNNVVYSDIATAATGGKVYAGQAVKNSEGTAITNTSVWNYDFNKVTMLKIEFSWYGAVGALFLAYVPVGNGEARWVRVHHLRASNQLKISSLGNATLPITYLTYGGGSVNRLGIVDTDDKGYQTSSNHIVKYGASYYIDGGDRGTVRLYSFSNDNTVPVYGARYTLGSLPTFTNSIGRYIDVTSVAGLPADVTFFMNARLTTSSNEDQNVEIIWVNTTPGSKFLYLNTDAELASNSGLTLISARPTIIFGLKAKENILNLSGVGVRNRVQVYPTKLSTANLGSIPVKMKILKTPYFQPKVSTTGTFTLSAPYVITAANAPIPTTSNSYLTRDGEFIYGWFRADIGTVFGRLSKANGNYYFTLLQTFSVPVTLLTTSPFLNEGRFDFQGNSMVNVSESIVTKERLSSVFISTQIQCPVPKTGIEIASFFLKPGADQFDLLSYFDYNKDYLSFPLTNQIESLYLACNISQLASAAPADISSSLTWEEQ